MDKEKIQQLKSMIDDAQLVSFDVFDTLLFRKTNTPETVFDLTGRHFGIHGFRKMRMEAQDEASSRAYAAFGYPHADMEQIYQVLSEHDEIPVDWSAVKEFEIALERDALTANPEMREIFLYAKSKGKRIVAASDMYLFAETLESFLTEKGFEGFDRIYCSADEHKAKFNKQLFEHISLSEGVAYENMLHIGDKARDDGEFPGEFGIKTFIIGCDADMEKIKDAPASDIDKGLYKILCSKSRGFWYDLGAEVGGPIYLALFRYVEKLAAGRKIFFLSRDGYNLHRLFKDAGRKNTEYLLASRRSLLLAGIRHMDEAAMASLPPYTLGQTVGEILDYLCIDRAALKHFEQSGLESFDRVIKTQEDINAFKKLYTLDEEVFLARCRWERENALKYFRSVGLFDGEALIFDCGWQGSSQLLLENFKKAAGISLRHDFVYFGIKNNEKSRRQLRGMHYDCFLFDFWKNFSLQSDLDRNVVMYELFFSAPHESVFCYDAQGQAVFEQGCGDSRKADLLEGIRDFVALGLDFAEKYSVECSPESCTGHLKRLIHLPTAQEAVTIGDVDNVDGFARQQGSRKYIARVSASQIAENPDTEIYWMNGLLRRPDISEELKLECARLRGIAYPAEVPEYHLEDQRSIRNYHRWLKNSAAREHRALAFRPMFSVVIPVYNTVTEQLEACFDSVLAQNYDNFELILVDDHSSWPSVAPVLKRYESSEKVRVIYRRQNGHISRATNDGIAAARGSFIVFMDCDDTIEPNALYEFALKLNENPELDFIYSDEDKLTEDGKIRHMPFFKPDWSPDLFLNMMYTNHLAAYRTELVRAVGGLRSAYNGSQDYDFTLRFMELSHNSRVGHVPKVLYHWRERRESVAFAMSSKNYAAEAARMAKEDYIRRNSIPARLEYIDGMSQYRMVYLPQGQPLVSIIIPSKDHPELLRQCISSIMEYTGYTNFEFVVVDNGSSPENRRAVSAYLESIGAAYIYEQREFNFSRMCNLGAEAARGEYLLFLNDDIEIFQPQWLERMLGQAQQKHSGAVGAKLYYPGTTLIQHAGVSNPQDGPLHSFVGLDDSLPYYFGWNRTDNNCIAVTGACLMLSKEKFHEAGGFDEALPVAYNDVKLCFRLHELGYYNIIRNDALAYHHESLTRGSDMADEAKLLRMSRERAELFARFPLLKDRDPYMSPNLRRWSSLLEPKNCCDRLLSMDTRGCGVAHTAFIDLQESGEYLRIVGWSLPERSELPQDVERFLLFTDPFGKSWGAPVQPVSRPDVAAHFGKPEYLLAGFECLLDRRVLRCDILPYRIGLLSIHRDGRRFICQCGETPVARPPRPLPLAPEERELKDFSPHVGDKGLRWSLDDCLPREGCHKIRGFAFPEGGCHHHYGKSLVLSSASGHCVEFETYPEERIDVACAFDREHFLFCSGFVCHVYDQSLRPGQEYEIFIRLRNHFDPKDIRDISTGKTISI